MNICKSNSRATQTASKPKCPQLSTFAGQPQHNRKHVQIILQHPKMETTNTECPRLDSSHCCSKQ